MAADNSFMVRRRQTWFCVIEVPPSLRSRLGRRLKRTLGTRDVNVARERRWQVIADLRGQIEEARRTRDGDPLRLEAAELREAVVEAKRQADAAPSGGGPDDPDAPDALLVNYIAERAEAVERQAGADAGRQFADMAFGRVTPLGHYTERWLTEGGSRGTALKERTKLERRRAVAKLAAWLERERLAATIEGVTRPVAGRYLSEELLPSGREAPTVAKMVRTLRAYFDWLRRRGHLPDDARNPWADQAPRRGRVTEEERAFTDAEVSRLLAGPADATLADFMLVAALTGMRREEIGRLTAADCAGGIFVVREGKTAAAQRRVPIHSGLSAVVARRTAGKAPAAFLFNELRSQNSERTDPIGKLFTRYRRGLGIQEGAGRRSLVNFHSFRRFFITAAVNASQPPHMVSLVAGHEEGRKGMTLGRYWQGADDDALRAVVEAVKLPAVPPSQHEPT